jgi:hypothetical protein
MNINIQKETNVKIDFTHEEMCILQDAHDICERVTKAARLNEVGEIEICWDGTNNYYHVDHNLFACAMNDLEDIFLWCE